MQLLQLSDESYGQEGREIATVNSLLGQTTPLGVNPADNHDDDITTLHICSALDCQTSLLVNSDEPTLAQARNRDDFAQFEKAMHDELASLIDHDVFVLVPRPPDKVLKGRWVFKIKRNPDHSIDRYKARYVAKGFLQEFGVNYHDTWAPTAHLATVRLLFARAAIEDLEIRP
jgi:hypothetical protein